MLTFDKLLTADVVGFDTETVGCDPRSESPVDKARMHCASFAVLTDKVSPFGYRHAEGLVTFNPLDVDLLFSEFRSRGVTVVAHNAAYDRHVLANHGIETEGVKWFDTLTHARWAVPEAESHTLKNLAVEILRKEPLGTFKDLFSTPRTKLAPAYLCECPEPLRTKADYNRHRKWGHAAAIGVKEVALKTMVAVPLPDITPDHRLYPILLQYSEEDAIMALELYSHFQEFR